MKNGILLVEYIQQLRAEGMDLRPALIAAGRHPVPADPNDQPRGNPGPGAPGLRIGPGSQMQQPLAIMVIGGLERPTCCLRG